MLSDDTTYAPLQLFEYDHNPGNYCLMLSDSKMGATWEVFEANGREGHGYGWTDVALGLIRAGSPELEARVGFDPEAGMFVAYGDDLEALRAVGAILRDVFHDHARLAEAVKAAPWEYD